MNNNKAIKKIVIFLGTIGIIGVTYFSYWNFYASKFEKTDNAYVNANQNLITTQVSGSVSSVLVSDTQTVKSGELIIKIDDTDLKISLDKAKNDLIKSIKNVKSLKYEQLKNEKNLILMDINFEKAKNDFNREKKAYDSETISKESFDNTKHIFEQAKLNIENAKLNLDNSKNLASYSVITDHPDIAKAITFYKQAFFDLKRTEINAVSNGVIAKKSVHVGQRVSVNQSLLTLIDLENEWVDANLKESQIKNLNIGQKVELISDVNDKHYIGYISGIGAGSGSSLSLLPAQNATGNWIKVVQRVPVRIELLNSSIKENGILPIGTSMEIKIYLNEKINENEIKSKARIEINNENEFNSLVEKIIKENLK